MKIQPKLALLTVFSGAVSGIAVALVVSYLIIDRDTHSDLLNGAAELVEPSATTTSALKTTSSVEPGVSSPKYIRDPLLDATSEQARENEARIAALQARLNSLVQGQALADAEDSEQHQQYLNDIELQEFSPEDARFMELEQWDAMKAAYEQEVIDPQWSEATNTLFIADIEELAQQNGFVVVNTECRTTQCSAVVEWPSFSEAALGFTALLHHSYNANCARETLLPEPEGGELDASYQVTIIFDCSEWRNSASS